jgi:hypothetical protein
MADKRDGRSGEEVEALLESVRGSRTWTDEEVLELAYEEHLSGEQLFDYCENPEAEPVRGVVEAHAAGCAFCRDQLDAVWRLTAPAEERVLVRLCRRLREGVEELGRLAAGAAGSLVSAGPWRPEFALTGGAVALEGEPAAGATFQLTLPLAEGGLRLAVVLRIRDRERFDLKATALAPEAEPVEGIRLEVEGAGTAGPVALVSDDWGDFVPEQGEGGWVCRLPLGTCRLRVRVPGRAEEFGAELPDVRELCRRELAAKAGTGDKT